MKIPKTIRKVMNIHNMGATEFSARTGIPYNSCRNAHAGQKYPRLDKFAPLIHFALLNKFDIRDYQ